MTIEEMRERKRELGYTYERIAELSNLPVGTVQKVLGGITKSPRYDTLWALETVFQKKVPYEYFMDKERGGNPDDMVRETSAYRVKCQGEYTLEDYYALPDEKRVELIDGVFYDMASPTHIHQAIGGKIFRIIADYIDRNQGKCMPLYAPMDVQLDRDERTMVQPDVLVVCDRDKFRRGVVYGAPDFIVEILSPSTRKKDITKKVQKYSDAGVREYWMVDPDKMKVIVYDFDNDELPVIYGFEDCVPVRIFQNACTVDFSEIYSYIEFLYGRLDDTE